MNPASVGPVADVSIDPEARRSLLHNRDFMVLWVAQAISQIAQNAIFFALMVFVESTTASSTQMSLLVLTTVAPTIALGVIAGVFVDRASKRTVLIVSSVARAVLVLGFIVAGETLAVVFFFNLLFSVISQFFAPAEAALIPLVVKRRHLLTANGLFNITFTSAQLAGFVLVGPPLLKLFGHTTLYLVVVAVFALAALICLLLPARDPGSEFYRGLAAGPAIITGLRSELSDGWELLRGDHLIRLSLVHVTVTTMLTLVMGMLAPAFAARVLGVGPDDSVFVMAPAGVGILVGILVLSRLNRPKSQVVNISLTLLALALGVLAAVQPLLGGIAVPEVPLVGDKWLTVGAVMVTTWFLGLAFAGIQVPAQTILQEQAPDHMRGKLFAVQLTLGSIVSLPPLVLLGGLADIYGVVPIIVVIAVILAGLAALSWRVTPRGAGTG